MTTNNKKVESFLLQPPKGRFAGNMSTYFRKMFETGSETFGKAISFLKSPSFQPYTPPPVVKPSKEEYDNDPILAENMYVQSIRSRAKAIDDLLSKEPKMYGFLWGNISEDSKSLLRNFICNSQSSLCNTVSSSSASSQIILLTFSEVECNQDPYGLCRLIIATHSVEITGITALDRNHAKKLYNDCKQYRGEKVEDFMIRFEDCYRGYLAAGGLPADDIDRIAQFITGLDSSRHAHFQASIYNDGSKFPSSLLEAQHKAANFKVPSSLIQHDKSKSSADSAVVLMSESVLYSKQHKSKQDKKKKKHVDNDLNSTKTHQETNKSNQKSKNKNKYASTSKPPRPCPICSGDHWKSDCPEISSAVKEQAGASKSKSNTVRFKDDTSLWIEEAFMSISDLAICREAYSNEQVMISNSISNNISRASTISPTQAILDTGASGAGIIKYEAVSLSLSDSNIITKINGIGGGFHSTLRANTAYFQDIPFCEAAPCNILGFKHVSDMYEIKFLQQQSTFVIFLGEGKCFNFIESDGLYVSDISTPTQLNSVLYSSINSNELKYTKREVIEAKKAKELIEVLGHPSSASVIQMLRHGQIIGTTVTPKSVTRAYDIYGPSLFELQGKTKRQSPEVVDTTDRIPTIISEQTMHTDIMYVQSIPFLVSIFDPLNYTACSYLAKEDSATIKHALQKQLSIIMKEGVTVPYIRSDNGKNLVSLKADIGLMGISIESGGGNSIPKIENKIRVIKERVRGYICTSPFVFARTILIFCVLFCVSRLNLLPSRTSNSILSPWENLTGRKLNMKHINGGFLWYGQGVPSGETTNSTSISRTQGFVKLYDLLNLEGSMIGLSLNTFRTCEYTQITWLPTPSEVITTLNAYASKDKKYQPTKEPIFRISSNIIADDNSEEKHVHPHSIAPLPDRINPSGLGTPESDLIDNISLPTTPIASDETNGIISADDSIDASMTEVELGESNELPSTSSQPAVQQHSEESTIASAQDHTTQQSLITNPAEPEIIHSSSSRPTRASKMSYKQRSQLWTEKEVDFRKSTTYEHGLHITASAALRKMPKKALHAMVSEIAQIADQNTMRPVDIRKICRKRLRKIIISSIFLKEKYLSNGTFDKLKARLVAGGHMQDRSLYDDLSSPTVSTVGAFITATLAAKEARKVVTVDIKRAYLNSLMPNNTEPVLMRLDELCTSILVKLDPSYQPYVNANGTVVVELQKALYGLVEAAKLWYQNLSETLVSAGFKANPVDPCVFNRTNSQGIQCTVCFHVDDLMITSRDQTMIDDIIGILRSKYTTISLNEGKVHSYLGLTFDFTIMGKVRITAKGFVDDLLKSTAIVKTAATPSLSDLFNIDSNSPALNESTRKHFHTVVAKCLYLSKRTRPDIMLTVSYLITRVAVATDQDQAKLDRLLRYINSTRQMGLTLSATNRLFVHCFIDASYGTHHDFKSHTGSSMTLGGGSIESISSKQKLVSKSSTEAELIGLSDRFSSAIWVNNFLTAQGYKMGPAIIHQDNMSTIALAEKGRSTSNRTRHINLRYFFIQDRIAQGDIVIEYTPTEDMIADVLTKPLQGQLFRKLRADLLGK